MIKKLIKELEARQFEEPYVAGINYALGVIERLEKESAPDEKFDVFWKKYPRHIAKKNALKAWQKLKVDDALFEKIMHALEKALVTLQWKNPQYIPHPATWLNGERWEDEVESANALPANDKYKGI